MTLGDEEASRRGVQKTVLERKGPSTFSCGVEIISKTELRVYRSLESTVDAILSGMISLLVNNMLFFFLIPHKLISKIEMTLVTSLMVWLITTLIGEGRFPNVEVRKMSSQEMKETIERELLISTSSDEENEIVVELTPGITNDTFTSEVPAKIGEECWEERVPLHLFVYGVRPHFGTFTNECK